MHTCARLEKIIHILLLYYTHTHTWYEILRVYIIIVITLRRVRQTR